VLYIKHVLNQLSPITLPDDDYHLFSDLLHSLETRDDITWRVFFETDIWSTISAAANRGGYHELLADEPFWINERSKALNRHWGHLYRSPERWEEDSDTVCVAPLLLPNSFGEGARKLADEIVVSDGEIEVGKLDPGFKLTLTPEQEALATRTYNQWLESFDRRVSWLKDHPPRPREWVPAPKPVTGIRNAWNMLFPDGRIEAGRSASHSMMAKTRKIKPIFRSPTIELVPFDWSYPDGDQELDEETKADLAALEEEEDRLRDRKWRQLEYQVQLKEKGQEKAEKAEL
jgi:hypothetical protein